MCCKYLKTYFGIWSKFILSLFRSSCCSSGSEVWVLCFMRSFFHGTSAVEFFRYVFMYVCMLERPTDWLSVCLSVYAGLSRLLAVGIYACMAFPADQCTSTLVCVCNGIQQTKKSTHRLLLPLSACLSLLHENTRLCICVYVYNGNNMTNFHQQATIIMRLLLPLYRYCIACPEKKLSIHLSYWRCWRQGWRTKEWKCKTLRIENSRVREPAKNVCMYTVFYMLL